MKRAFTNIKQLTTMSSRGPVRNATLITDDDKITYAGPENSAPLGYCDEIHSLGGALVTPGLIDAHTHVVFGGNRVTEFEQRATGATYESIAKNGGGIISTVNATRAESVSQLMHSAAARLQWMINNGTTTAEVKSGYGLTTQDELKMLNAAKAAAERASMRIVPTLLAAHAVPPEFSAAPDEYVDLICNEMVPKAAEHGVPFVDAFVESIAFTKPQVERIILSAQKHGMQARLHVDQLSDSGGAAFAAQMKAKTADHLEHTSIQGIQQLAAADVQPVLLPGSVLMLGKSHYPNAKAMIDAGLDVVLATDFNPGSSPVCSLPAIMTLAVTMMQMTPAQALKATTVNAAKSLNMDRKVGQLEPGMQADFVVWDADDYREIPYWLGAPLVKQTWIAGVRRDNITS